MDKREYIFRLLTFFVISAAIMFGLQWASKKYMPAPAPRPMQQAQTQDRGARSQAEMTTTALHRDLASTATLAENPTTSRTTTEAKTNAIPRDEAPRVRLTTKVFDIDFSTRGGVPVRWDVIDPRFAQLPVDAKGEPIRGSDKRDLLIDPGLIGNSKVQLPLEVILFEANARYYSEFNETIYKTEGPLIDGQPGWRFTSEPNEAGIQLIKTYRLKPESYVCDFELQLVNHGQHNISFDKDDTGLGLQLGPGVGKELPASNPMSRFARVDVVTKSGEALFSRELKKPADQEIINSGGFDWGGIQGLYYAAVLIPNKAYPFTTAKAYVDGDLLTAPAGAAPGATLIQDSNLRFYPSVELYGKPFRLNAGESKNFKYEFFVGPNQSQVLHAADHDLNKLMFHDSYWFMRELALGLMSMLRWFHMMVGNWGVGIILLTFTVRLLVFPLVHKGLKSQAKAVAEQQRLKPLMDKINEKYKDDPVRRQQEVMKLFKEHGVNPLGGLKGCFWMLIQLPIFFALYKLLSHSIELRGAHFLWVTDLSQADRLFLLPVQLPFIGNHFNLLPIIVAITQMLTSKFMSQPPTDPQQAQMQKMMLYFMPVFVLFITYGFPAGLMLYWLVSNVWQVVQQIWVNKHMPRPGTPGTSPAIPVRKKA
jgi:YidC/Oxa1 family membrane protein insertase